MAETQHHKEGVVIIMEDLDPERAQPWMRASSKLRVADSTLVVSPRLMVWPDHDELRSMRQEWW